MGGLRHGDRPTGKEIVAHLESAFRALPAGVKKIFARADSGFYCWEAVEAYEQARCQFVLVARKTRRLVEQLQQAEWKPSPHSDAAAECEFLYQPQGWGRACRFVALRYEKEPETDEVKQYQLFETSAYTYRVFVTNLAEPIAVVVWFYNQRAGAENLIKEANNDAGLAAHPSRRFDMNRNHFQLVMLAYNLNCWLLLFQREADATPEKLRHTTLATARLRFLFRGGQDLAACRQNGHQLQRSVPGAGTVRAADAAAAGDGAAGIKLRAGGGGCAALRGAVHRILCTCRKLLRTCRL